MTPLRTAQAISARAVVRVPGATRYNFPPGYVNPGYDPDIPWQVDVGNDAVYEDYDLNKNPWAAQCNSVQLIEVSENNYVCPNQYQIGDVVKYEGEYYEFFNAPPFLESTFNEDPLDVPNTSPGFRLLKEIQPTGQPRFDTWLKNILKVAIPDEAYDFVYQNGQFFMTQPPATQPDKYYIRAYKSGTAATETTPATPGTFEWIATEAC